MIYASNTAVQNENHTDKQSQSVTVPFCIKNKIVEMVNGFTYLSCWVKNDINSEKEIEIGVVRFKELPCEKTQPKSASQTVEMLCVDYTVVRRRVMHVK